MLLQIIKKFHDIMLLLQKYNSRVCFLSLHLFNWTLNYATYHVYTKHVLFKRCVKKMTNERNVNQNKEYRNPINYDW
jgi:hypothetical protein